MSRRAKPSTARVKRFNSWEVDQVFLRFEGGRIVATIWTISSENEVRQERLFAPHTDPVEAVAWLGDAVAAKGKVSSAFNVRLRWASSEQFLEKLKDDKSLEQVFIDAFEAARDDVRAKFR
ncbi:MAG: hypothetical protein ACK41E_07035 [Deinococcales bacterium]